MPAAAVYVGRPTRWGNPFALGGEVPQSWNHTGRQFEVVSDRRDAVDLFRALVTRPDDRAFVSEARSALAGRDLVCWCPLAHPCHADVLLELVNSSMAGWIRSEGS